MNTIFTVVSNNYFVQAILLMDSIRSFYGEDELETFVFIADEPSTKIDYSRVKAKVIFAKDCCFIDNFVDMAFKYNIIEFNTGIKPFIFENLLRKYSKVIYLDPDIVVFDNLDCIFDKLESYSMILTPHLSSFDFNEPHEDELGNIWCGYFNLGFCALNNSNIGKQIAVSWKNRLKNYCWEGYKHMYVDQRWMEYLFCNYFKDTYVEYSLGFNIAPWNLKERKLICESDSYYVVDRNDERHKDKLVFFHFSGMNPSFKNNDDYILKFRFRNWIYEFIDEPIKKLFLSYLNKMKENHASEISQIPYAYSSFSNGKPILKLHRHLYENYKELNKDYHGNPFDATGEFYISLKKNKLLVKKEEINPDCIHSVNLKDDKGLGKKAYFLDSCLRIICKILGISKFAMLIKYINKQTSDMNQQYLLKEVEKK